MARSTWVWRNGKVVPKAEAAREEYASISHLRSTLPAPYVRSDYIKEFVSHVDGKTPITSKSQWEKHVKHNGCQIIGNDKPDVAARGVVDVGAVKQDMAQAFEMHEQGYEAPPLERTDEFGSAQDLVNTDYVRADVAVDTGGVA